MIWKMYNFWKIWKIGLVILVFQCSPTFSCILESARNFSWHSLKYIISTQTKIKADNVTNFPSHLEAKLCKEATRWRHFNGLNCMWHFIRVSGAMISLWILKWTSLSPIFSLRENRVNSYRDFFILWRVKMSFRMKEAYKKAQNFQSSPAKTHLTNLAGFQTYYCRSP